MSTSVTLGRDVSRNLVRHLPAGRAGWTPHRYAAAGWVGGAAFVLAALSLGITLRLGVPLVTALGVLVFVIVCAVAVLSWLGRTMAAPNYFFAGYNAGGATVGLSALNDWIGGAMMLVLIAFPIQALVPYALAIVAASAVQTTCLAPMMQRSGTITVPGLMAWRTGAQRTGLAALPAVLVICGLLALAEGRVIVATLDGWMALETETLVWGVLAIAAIPALVGGMQALLAVNLVLALLFMLSLLVPAVQLAFIGVLPGNLPDMQALAPLSIAFDPSKAPVTVAGALVTFLVVVCGLSTLPMAMGRVALTTSGTRAMRAGNWSMLSVFLVLASLPLALTLLRGEPSAEAASQSAPMLAALPRLALLLAAFNALAALLHVGPTALVRALRRTQRRDPSERSMAMIRLLVLASTGGLGFALTLDGTAPRLEEAFDPFMLAIAIAAAGLFPVLMAAAWLSRISWTAHVAAMLAGPVVTVGLTASGTHALTAGFAGLLLSVAIIAVAKFAPMIVRREPLDARAPLLRRPES